MKNFYLSRKFYTSIFWEIGALFLVFLFVLSLFILSGSFDRINQTDVSINTFAPVMWVHFGNLLLFTILGLLALSNAGKMFYFIILKDDQKIPLVLYFKELKIFIKSVTTQNDWFKCSKSINSSSILF